MFPKLILLSILTEALIELFFYAEPLEKFRLFIIRHTAFLKINDSHLFECKYCLSFWIGAIVFIGYFYMNWMPLRIVAYGIIVHRTSNYVHTIYGSLRDAQINLRLQR